MTEIIKQKFYEVVQFFQSFFPYIKSPVVEDIKDSRAVPDISSLDHVLESILAKSSVSTLRKSRLVCSRWYDVSTKELQKRTHLNIHFLFDYVEFYRTEQKKPGSYMEAVSFNDRRKITRSNILFSKEAIQSLQRLMEAMRIKKKNTLTISPCTSFRISTCLYPSPYVQNLISSIGHHVKKLILEMEYKYFKIGFEESQAMFLLKKLITVQVPNLEKLGISFSIPNSWEYEIENWNRDDTKFFIDPSENISLPNLRSLVAENPFPQKIIREIAHSSVYQIKVIVLPYLMYRAVDEL